MSSYFDHSEDPIVSPSLVTKTGRLWCLTIPNARLLAMAAAGPASLLSEIPQKVSKPSRTACNPDATEAS
eukprot:5503867-Pyramimonas_sp.AAC.1